MSEYIGGKKRNGQKPKGQNPRWPQGQPKQQSYLTVKDRKPLGPDERVEIITQAFSSIRNFRYSDILEVVNNLSAEITSYNSLAPTAAKANMRDVIDSLKVGGPGYRPNTPNFIDALSQADTVLYDKQVDALVTNGIIEPDNDAERQLFYTSIKNILKYGLGELEDAGSDALIRGTLEKASGLSRSLSNQEKDGTPIDVANVNKFKTVSENFETAATALERIEKAIMATSDTFDFADGYEFYANIENLYTQKFQILSLIDDAKDSIEKKLMTGGLTLEDLKQRATEEKAKEVEEDYNAKLKKLEDQQEAIDREVTFWNGKLAGAVSIEERRNADKKLTELFTATQKTIETGNVIQAELLSSRTGEWFDYVEEKSDNYVDIAGILFQTRKERIEAEKKQKEATARFLNATSIQKSIDDCLKDMKNISTAKCDRINQVREIYRRAKEIEANKSELVQNAALMLNPSRGAMKFSDELNNGQRLKRFEVFISDMTSTYQQWTGTNLDDTPAMRRNGKYPIGFYVDPGNETAIQTDTRESKIRAFKRDFDIFFNTYLSQVVTSSAIYGEESSSENDDLNKLKASNLIYSSNKDGSRVNMPQTIPLPAGAAARGPPVEIPELYTTYFKENTKLAIKILQKQQTLLKLMTQGGDLVRQQIDQIKRDVDEKSEKLFLDYETVKTLPTEIERSEETVRKCFNEGFDKTKREKEAALKEEIAKIKSAYDSELVFVEKEYKENLIKAKNEVREVRETPQRKEFKDMSPDELEREYNQLLSSVQELDNKIKQNRPEDSRRIPELQGRLSNLRAKLAEVGRLRKPAGGYRHATRRRRVY